ncbi:MAG: hypothetical protein ABFS14_03025 [Gemmatimonadota bacterium]
MKPGRFFYKIAAWWLLVAAAAHSVGHYLFYIDESRFSSDRLDVAKRMQALVADPVLDGSLWRMLQAFSLSFALFLLFAGLASLVLLRGKPGGALLQRMANFNALFWGSAFVLIFLIHPTIQLLIISGVAFVLFALSRLSLSGKKVLRTPGGEPDPGTEPTDGEYPDEGADHMNEMEGLDDMDDISVEELLGEETS